MGAAIVAADVKDTIKTGFDEVHNDIAEVREGKSRIKSRGRRRGKYADVGNLCLIKKLHAQQDQSRRCALEAATCDCNTARKILI